MENSFLKCVLPKNRTKAIVMKKIYSIDISYLKHVCPPAFRITKTKGEKEHTAKTRKKKSRHLKMSLCPYFNFIDTCGFKELIILITSMRPPPYICHICQFVKTEISHNSLLQASTERFVKFVKWQSGWLLICKTAELWTEKQGWMQTKRERKDIQ